METEPYLVYETLFYRDGTRAGQWCPRFFDKDQQRPPELRPPILYTWEELRAESVSPSRERERR